jgi:hypothetical protein
MGGRRTSNVDELKEQETRRKVALMRELGIVVLDGLTLGPEPLPKTKLPKPDDDPRGYKRRHYEDMLGRKLSDEEVDRLP